MRTVWMKNEPLNVLRTRVHNEMKISRRLCGAIKIFGNIRGVGADKKVEIARLMSFPVAEPTDIPFVRFKTRRTPSTCTTFFIGPSQLNNVKFVQLLIPGSIAQW